eukprot:TRINITY_DN2199_c0_g1_i2.p1 TRINITY_DN2199_c0_g1~~TRINITY_DN2199_c0_g1_i2.p1  ORF type:complete len:105 (+),score=22.10 TRINITY_DN2199_c0_g1_i2:111-425(+)
MITSSSSSLTISFSPSGKSVVSVSSSVVVTAFIVVAATVVVLTSSMVVGSAVVDVDATCVVVVVISGKIVVSGTAGTTSGTKALCLQKFHVSLQMLHPGQPSLN